MVMVITILINVNYFGEANFMHVIVYRCKHKTWLN
jgi:hypothetical protein